MTRAGPRGYRSVASGLVKDILEAILAGDPPRRTAPPSPVPEHYRGVTVHEDEVEMFEGRPSRDKDPRESLHLDDVRDPGARVRARRWSP